MVGRGSSRNSPLSLGQDLLLGSEDDSGPRQVLTAYLDYMEELGMLLGGQPTSTREQMRQVLELEIELANITVPHDQRRDEEKIYHKMSIAELQVGQARN